MTTDDLFRVDVSQRSAEEFISEMRGVADRMVANAANDAERDMALGLCDWADKAEQERRLAQREAWLDEQIAKAKAGGWVWGGEQAWMDAHMPNLKAEAIADWARGPGTS